ncbi:MAG TPA: ABC transporter substrate-binding protein [Bryobacteraceae bacterium]|nr:ABC transporter substrate-binding protein [Bryobacteraceae bacterium]
MNRRRFLQTVPALAALAGCARPAGKVRLALNWKPDPQFGGFYAAGAGAAFTERRLEVEILPGGAGTPTVQMVGAGSAEFGVSSADEVVMARARGNDVAALFAVFQNNPQGIMVHASRKLESLGDVFREGTVALQRGLPYARLLEKKYGFGKVKIVPSPGGDLSVFLSDEKFAQQCFVFVEPLAARRKGVDVKVFAVMDAGYNPYTGVMITSGELLRKQPDRVKAMVEAVREGWRAYLDDPRPTNRKMHEMNPTMEQATFDEIAEAQKPFIETDETRKNGLGVMTAERWETLIRQLQDLGDITRSPPAAECFRTF